MISKVKLKFLEMNLNLNIFKPF